VFVFTYDQPKILMVGCILDV